MKEINYVVDMQQAIAIYKSIKRQRRCHKKHANINLFMWKNKLDKTIPDKKMIIKLVPKKTRPLVGLFSYSEDQLYTSISIEEGVIVKHYEN